MTHRPVESRRPRLPLVVGLAASLGTLGLLLGGAAAWILSHVPFDLAQTTLDSWATDGRADGFDRERFDRVVFGLRFAGSILLLAAGGSFALRRSILSRLLELVPDFRALWSDAASYWREFLAEDRFELFAFLVVLGSGIAVRAFFLCQPAYWDETWTFNGFASKPIWIALSHYSSTNNHVFHTLLMHLCYVVAGDSLWVLRLPAFFSGVLLIPVSYVVVHVLFHRSAALLAAGIVSGSVVLISYSANGRGYTLLCLLFLLCVLLGSYLIEHRNRVAWILFSLASALGFYTVPIMLFPFGGVILWLVFSVLLDGNRPDRRRFLLDLIVSLVMVSLITLALYAPVLVGSGLDALVANPTVKSHSLTWFLEHWSSAPGMVWDQWFFGVPGIVRWVLALGAVACVLFQRSRPNQGVRLVGLLLVSTAAVLLAMRVEAFPRTLVFLFVPFAGMAAMGVVQLATRFAPSGIGPQLRGRILAASTVALTLGLCLDASRTASGRQWHSLEVGYNRFDAGEVASFLAGHLKPGDRVLTASIPNYAPFEYYFVRNGLPSRYLTGDVAESRRVLIVTGNLLTPHGVDVRFRDGSTRSFNPEDALALEALMRSRGEPLAVQPIREYGFATLHEAILDGGAAD